MTVGSSRPVKSFILETANATCTWKQKGRACERQQPVPLGLIEGVFCVHHANNLLYRISEWIELTVIFN